jgi:hypothetical protein
MRQARGSFAPGFAALAVLAALALAALVVVRGRVSAPSRAPAAAGSPA